MISRGQQLQRTNQRRGLGRRGGAPHPIDIHVGSRVKLRRNMLGISQEKLGEALGLTFQQVQKYERGANRISASRLLEIARVLEVPIAFFYDDVDPVRAPAIPADIDEVGYQETESDHLLRDETVELVTCYYSVGDERTRRRLFDLAKALWEKDNPRTGGRRGAPRGRKRRRTSAELHD